MGKTFDSIRDKAIVEFLKFLAKRLWFSTTMTTAVVAGLAVWLSTMWEVAALWTLSATLIVMLVLIHFRDRFLPKDLFLKRYTRGPLAIGLMGTSGTPGGPVSFASGRLPTKH